MKEVKAHEIVKQLRLENGLSQKELADKVGLTQQAIALLESGKRKLEFDLFVKILNEIGTTPEKLSEIINIIFSRPSIKSLETLDDFENFFCYLESLGYTLSVLDVEEMEKYKFLPYNENDYLIGITDIKRDNVTFFHRADFINFQQEVAKTIDYELYKQFIKEDDPPQS